jgi:archaemetzincin
MYKSLILCISLCVLTLVFADEPVLIIGVQPLGEVPEDVLTTLYHGIDSVYNAKVVFSHIVPMPAHAFYPPRRRYRADSLLRYLDAIGDSCCTKIVGITTHDISTTKEPHEDWGIFGLGSLGGFSCVVSTYRLKSGNVSAATFHERLIKVVNHELGHTFGLYHCPTARCLMEDAKGKIATVDNETGVFCPQCKNTLRGKVR